MEHRAVGKAKQNCVHLAGHRIFKCVATNESHVLPSGLLAKLSAPPQHLFRQIHAKDVAVRAHGCFEILEVPAGPTTHLEHRITVSELQLANRPLANAPWKPEDPFEELVVGSQSIVPLAYKIRRSWQGFDHFSNALGS